MFDLHMHTVFSDGKNTAEEMVQQAIRLGLDTVGISDHSSGDPCGMKLEENRIYKAEIARLKEKYAGQIRVLCGLERDFLTDDFTDYDYTIGSVHWLPMPDGHRISIDWTAEKLREGAEKYFGGDMYSLAEAFYAAEARVAEVTKCDIIGHFDLITKFIETDPAMDLHHPRYVRAWQQAARRRTRRRRSGSISGKRAEKCFCRATRIKRKTSLFILKRWKTGIRFCSLVRYKKYFLPAGNFSRRLSSDRMRPEEPEHERGRKP